MSQDYDAAKKAVEQRISELGLKGGAAVNFRSAFWYARQVGRTINESLAYAEENYETWT